MIDRIIKYLTGYFNSRVVLIFILTGIILVFKDGSNFYTQNKLKEAKFAQYTGYIYISAGVLLLFMSLIIKKF